MDGTDFNGDFKHKVLTAPIRPKQPFNKKSGIQSISKYLGFHVGRQSKRQVNRQTALLVFLACIRRPLKHQPEGQNPKRVHTFLDTVLLFYIHRQVGVVFLLLVAVDGSGVPHHRLQGIDKCKKAFCFEYELLFHNTGKFVFNVGEDADILGHYRSVGLSRDQTLAEAEDTIQFLLDEYGLNFTAATEDERLGIGPPAVAAGVDVTITPFRIDTDEKFRLVSASSRYGFDFINEPVKDGGWRINFNEEYVSTGRYNYTIPAGSFVPIGSYIIDPCPKWSRFCFTFLKRRDALPIIIRFRPRTFVQFGGPSPEQAILVNLDVFSEQFGGAGIVRGSIFMTDEADGYDLRSVMTFPPFRDD